MKVDINNALTIIGGLIVVIGAIYRLAKIEANINSRISLIEVNILIAVDTLKDNLVDKINQTNGKLEIHVAKYDADKEYIYLYRLNHNQNLVEHKFNRLANWIAQISGYLHRKDGFQIRDDKF